MKSIVRRRGKKVNVDPRAVDWIAAPNRSQPVRHLPHIKIGKRHRKDMGDLVALARDINERGLLHPIVIDHENRLIAGERRVKAWQLSIFRAEPIPVHVVPLKDIVAGEWAENNPSLRKDFKPSEQVAIKQAIEARLRPVMLARQAQAGRDKKKPADGSLRAADLASAFVGKSRRSVEKAEAICAAAEKNPKKYGPLLDAMDKSGRVDAPFKRMQVMKAAELIRKEPPPLPDNGPYRGGVIDFPWAAEPGDDDAERLARGYYPYPTMSLKEIVAFCRERIAGILHADVVVALWITNYHLALGHHVPVLEALGLGGVTVRTWFKNKMGRGQVLRGKTEHAVFARRGRPIIEVGNITTELFAPAGTPHSRKPQKFFDDFEQSVAAPRYFSLFETADRGAKWDCHGDKMRPREVPDLLGSALAKATPANGVPA